MTRLPSISLVALATLSAAGLAQAPGDEQTAAAQNTGTWSFKPGSGITFDAGDTFKLNLKSQVQPQFTYTANEADQDPANFRMRRARITLSGHVFDKNVNYVLKLDAVDDGTTTTNGPVKDAFVHYNFLHDDGRVGLRMGQGKPFFGLEATGSSAGLDFVERSVATRAFADVRSRGAWLHGAHAKNTLRWSLGAQNTDVANAVAGINETGEEGNNPDNGLVYVAHLSFDPLGDMMGGKDNEAFKQGDVENGDKCVGTIGVGGQWGNNRTAAGAGATDVESTAINLNTAWRCHGLAFLGEFFGRSDDPQGGTRENTSGWMAQISYALPKRENCTVQWGIAGRVSMISSDDTTAFLSTSASRDWAPLGTSGAPASINPGDILEATIGIDMFYSGHNCKTQINYTRQQVDPNSGTDVDNDIIALQFTLVF